MAAAGNPHIAYLSENFTEMCPLDFYRELFPSGELDREGEFTEGKYTAIAVRVFNEAKVNGKPKVHRYTVCDDLKALDGLFRCDEFCVMSPVSYAGKSQRQANARFLYAVVFDLDGLLTTEGGESKSLINLFGHIDLGLIPKPSHIVFSGTGLHVYYMLQHPLPLFPSALESLNAYRSRLVPRLWNRYITSLHAKPQYESATQGFRMVGTTCKDGKARVRAFKVGEKVGLEYLNSFTGEDDGIQLEYIPKTPLPEAKAKWPEWYERRVVRGQPRGSWAVKRDLYDWWKLKIKDRKKGAAVGHRYFCVMALAVYARKCGIGYEELERDAMGLVPFLNGLDPSGTEPFTGADAVKALEAYDASYITFPRHTIEELTAIEIPRNKRNGRKQELHLRLARANLEILGEDAGHALQGRPKGSGTKKEEIRAYAAAHPEANHSEIARALGVSRPTVIKWLKD